MAFGDYPPEYDAKHHGPYDPARYYGKRKSTTNLQFFNEKKNTYLTITSHSADIPFGKVKLGELSAWLSRREMSAQSLAGMISRAWWRWNHKYVLPKRAGIAPLFQLLAGSCLFFYVINYGNISEFFGGNLTEDRLVVLIEKKKNLFQSTIEITNITKLLHV